MEDSALINASAGRLVTDEPVMTEVAVDEFWDTVDDGYLDFSRVIEVCAEEIMWVESANLFVPAHRSEATSKPVDLKWVPTKFRRSSENRQSKPLVWFCVAPLHER